jgi:catecholate siderophore receptor
MSSRQHLRALMRQRYLTASAMGLALAAASFGAASAADGSKPVQLPALSVEDSELNEPSSPKFTAPLIDTPQTISVIPQSVFLQQGAQNLTEVLRNTPGITFNAGENGFTSGLSNFSMRGFDTTGSIFIDGVRDSGNYSRDVFNLEQVEVAKGPAADNGRGSPGGYVNLVTKTPHLTASIQGSGSFGFDEYDSKNRARVSADINQPISDAAAVRLNLVLQDGGVIGRSVARQEMWGFAPSAALGLGTSTRFIVSYQHTEQDDVPDWGVPAALIGGMLRYDATLDSKALRDNFYGLAADFDHVFADAALARIEHDFASGLTISNQTRWSKTARETSYTLTSTYTAATQVVATQRQANARENTSLSNLTNLRGTFATGSLQHTFSTGIEFAREKSTADRFPAQTNPGGTMLITAPNPARAGNSALAPTQVATVKIDTIAAYAYDTMEIGSSWQVTGGLRAENYKVDIDSSTVAGAPQGPDAYDVSRTTLSGKLGAVYKPAANGSIYAAVGLAAMPPGSYLSNPDISREGDNAFPGYSAGINSAGAKQQYSLNYEIGTKWDLFDNMLNTTAAVFRTERKNVAMTGIDPSVTPQPTATTLLGYGEQVVQGIELGAAGSFTPDWSVFGGIVFMDSERKHSAFLDAGRRLANPGDYGTVLRTSGDELAFSTNVSANLWTTYRLPFGLTVGGGLQYVGSSWVGRPDDAERIIPNGAAGKLPSYVVFNTLLEYGVTPNVVVRLNVDNITNKLYAVSTNWPTQRVLLGPSRNFLLSTHLSF